MSNKNNCNDWGVRALPAGENIARGEHDKQSKRGQTPARSERVMFGEMELYTKK